MFYQQMLNIGDYNQVQIPILISIQIHIQILILLINQTVILIPIPKLITIMSATVKFYNIKKMLFIILDKK